ncbi:MAG TPA: S8 family serine peptidase [Actinomyces sp.]|nr:S8 family serine peptidase [Actinomyces sp.]
MAPASAEETDSWFYHDLGYDQLHAQGLDGEGITIAIVEVGPTQTHPTSKARTSNSSTSRKNARSSMKSEKSETWSTRRSQLVPRPLRHGSDVACVIVGQGGPGRIHGVAPKAKLLVFEQAVGLSDYTGPWPEGCKKHLLVNGAHMIQAEQLGADIFSYSLIGYTQPTNFMNAYWQMRGKALVVGSGNEKFVGATAAGLPGVVSVTATRPGNTATDWASEGPEITVGAPGEELILRDLEGNLDFRSRGTSFAAPIVASTLALGKQKWPDATYNQLIQSLTATASGDGTRTDKLGYGAINPTAFINNDPTQYPDEPITYPDSSRDDPD